MVSYEDIRELQQYPTSNDSLVLSLYVDIDQSKAVNLNRGFETAVESLFRQMSEGNGNHRKRCEEERNQVMRFFREYQPHGRGLVIFSDIQKRFWWHRDLQVQVATEGRLSPHPWVRPLLAVLEEHDRFAAVLIDKHRGRILTVDAMGMEQVADLISDVPNRHATTGTDHIWSQGQMGRDHLKHLKWHASHVATELETIVDRNRIECIVVGGPIEATSVFVNELPKRLQNAVIDTIQVPIDASYDRLLEELRSAKESYERSEEAKLVESMVTAAHKNDRAVLGAVDTIEAINEGRVYCMVVARDYRAEGAECSSCRSLFVEQRGECPVDGATLSVAPDLINRASRRVLEQDGRVRVVSREASNRLGQTGIGAILRF